MARMILAAVAALCALAAVSGLSILDELSEQQKKLLPDDLDLIGSSPDDTLEAILEALQALRDRIQETVDDAEEAVKNTEEAIETDAAELGKKLSDRVQEWVEKANKARVDVNDCVDDEVNMTLVDVPKLYVKETIGCVTQPIKDLVEIVQNLRDIGQDTQDALQQGTDALEECNDKRTLESLPCRIKAGGKLGVELTQLSAKAATNVAKAVNLVSNLQTNFESCTNEVAESSIERAASVVGAAIKCIAQMLAPSS